jgi:hypothetical protein
MSLVKEKKHTFDWRPFQGQESHQNREPCGFVSATVGG